MSGDTGITLGVDVSPQPIQIEILAQVRRIHKEEISVLLKESVGRILDVQT